MYLQLLQGTFLPLVFNPATECSIPPKDGLLCAGAGCATLSDVQQIAALANPPLIPLNADEIYVRRCRLAGDAVDQKGGCFRTEDLPKLLELVQGAPALVGHNQMSIAIARFFGGEIETYQNHQYIVPKLYWLKQHSRAEDLRLEIDGGLVTEASIAFVFRQATCNLCERDIRLCKHQVGQSYDGKLCHYWYDGIERVLEGSLVYRGAEPYTAFLPNRLHLSDPSPTPKPADEPPLPIIKWQNRYWRLSEIATA